MMFGEPIDQNQPDLRHDDAPYVVASTLLAAYCHALDTGSSGQLRRLLADDVVLELPDTTHVGADAVAASYAGFFAAPGRTTRHHLTNVRLVEREPEIVAEAYLLAVTWRDGHLSLASGHYRSAFRYLDDGWRITRKRIELAIPFTRLTTPE